MRKTNKIILLLLTLCITLNVNVGCNSTYSESISIAKETESGTIIYNGCVYEYREEINRDRYLYELLHYNELKVVASLWTGDVIPRKTPVLVSDLDINENILKIDGPAFGASGYFVKDDFTLPVASDGMEVEKIFIASETTPISVSNVQGITYNNLFEFTDVVLKIDKKERFKSECYCILKGYEYIRSCRFYLIEQNDVLYGTRYMNIEDEDNFSITAFDCRKLKDEYQEVFKTAMNQFNAMQAQ